ncbi:MAG: polysaccharide deacetylase family protein [Bdellovibrio sp.]
MKKPLSFLIISSVWALAACSNGGSGHMYAEMQESLQANIQAQSNTEWHLSDANPEKVFARWREDLSAKMVTSKEVCDAMAMLGDNELPLFEEEIRNSTNASLVVECRGPLLSRIDRYWSAERTKLTTNVDNLAEFVGSGLRFKTDVQYRDTSKGYYAVAGDVGAKQVVLTFDDGPSEIYTPTILNTLRSVDVKAIFFEVGKNVGAHPEVTRLVAKDGHALGGHSMTHSCLGSRLICQKQNHGHLFTAEEAIAEIKGSMSVIKKAAGRVDPFFRFPFGETSPEVREYLRTAGIGEFYWSVDSEDWRVGKTPQKVVDDVMAQLKTRGKGIILFHDIHRTTAEALPELLRQLYLNGYQPVLLKPGTAGLAATP